MRLELAPISTVLRLAHLCERLLALQENQSLAQQIESAITQHEELPFGATAERMAALRGLVGAVEAFLKAVGRMRHASDPPRLAALEQAMLRTLLDQGLVLPPVAWDSA